MFVSSRWNPFFSVGIGPPFLTTFTPLDGDLSSRQLPPIGVRWWGHPDSVKLAFSGLVRGLRAEVQLAVGPTGTQGMGLICPRAPFWAHETNDFLKTMVPIALRGRPVWKWCNLSSAITCSYSALRLDGWNLLAVLLLYMLVSLPSGPACKSPP